MIAQNNKSMLQQKLWDAAARGDSGAVRVLVLNGVDIDARNEDGFTAYSLATQNGHFNTALTILAARNMAYEAKLGFTPINGARPAETRKSA